MASKYIILWHGTNQRSADSIRKTGFYKDSYFTRRIGIAWSFASNRSGQDNPGVMILCAVDLNAYKKHDYEIRRGRIYHFIPSVSGSAIAGVFRIDRFNRAQLGHKASVLKNRIRELNISTKQYEIVITRNCGSEAIAYWINVYIAKHNRHITAMHPGVRQLREWVQRNYTHGRISPISEREMLIQAKRYLPEFFEGYFQSWAESR